MDNLECGLIVSGISIVVSCVRPILEWLHKRQMAQSMSSPIERLKKAGSFGETIASGEPRDNDEENQPKMLNSPNTGKRWPRNVPHLGEACANASSSGRCMHFTSREKTNTLYTSRLE